jgi:hypothetical protein
MGGISGIALFEELIVTIGCGADTIVILQVKHVTKGNLFCLAKGNGEIVELHTDSGVYFAYVNAVVGRTSCQRQAAC